MSDGWRIVEAACEGRMDDVRRLLHDEAVPASTERIKDAMTALHAAAFYGDLDLVRELLTLGAHADVNARGELQPMHFAAAMARVDCMKELVARGASVNAGGRFGTPILLAFALRYWEIARRYLVAPAKKQRREPPDIELLDQFVALGAQLDAVTPEGQGMLHLAAERGDIVLLKELVARGLDVNLRNASQQTPLLVAAAAEGGNALPLKTNIARVLLDAGADVNACDSAGHNAFYFGLRSAKLLKLLIERGVEPNVVPPDASYWTGLLRDRSADRIIEIAALVPNLETPRTPAGSPGLGPLYAFARENEPRLVAYFLSRGLKPIDRNSRGEGVLHGTLETSGGVNDHVATRMSIVETLLDAGADVNLRANDGTTPLMAAKRQPARMIDLLIRRGADVTAKNARGARVLDHFARAKNEEGLKCVVDAGG